MTDEQRSRRPIFIATLWAGASWLFFRVARSTRMTQIWALRSRLEKQPTDLRQNTSYFGDRTLGRLGAHDIWVALNHSRQSERLEGANCLGSHRISAHFGRREIDNIIDRSLCDVLQRFLGEKSLMSRNHDVWKGEQPRKTTSC